MLELYEADDDLRSLVVTRLGKVEVALRTTYAYLVGQEPSLHTRYLDDTRTQTYQCGPLWKRSPSAPCPSASSALTTPRCTARSLMSWGSPARAFPPGSRRSSIYATAARTTHACGATLSSTRARPRVTSDTERKRSVGQFAPWSVMDVLVSLDDVLAKASVGEPVVPTLLRTHGRDSLFLTGLTQPQPHKDARS